MKKSELVKIIRETVQKYSELENKEYKDYEYLNPPANARYHADHNDYFHVINNYYGRGLQMCGFKGKNGKRYSGYKKGNKIIGVFDFDKQLGWTLKENISEYLIKEEIDKSTELNAHADKFIKIILKAGTKNNLFDIYLKKHSIDSNKLSEFVHVIAQRLLKKW